ncbi:hypothetical protein C8R21_14110 [Nitrosospira multiformis]|uniref:Uncharacterized protein n=2 Tax=Nitrosospira multiformis TaxID=1231 RepID=A0A2T5I4D6_9PROT|nr:hypothetical protein C8R21_14110 [Nitrosospira multiformis]
MIAVVKGEVKPDDGAFGTSVHMTKRKGCDWLADSGGSNSRRTQANATLDAVILDGSDKLRNPRVFSRSSDRIEGD